MKYISGKIYVSGANSQEPRATSEKVKLCKLILARS